MSQTLAADQPVWYRTDYAVCAAGTYQDSDLVQCYATTDASKTPMVAFQALYVATGQHIGDAAPPPSLMGYEMAIWTDTTLDASTKLALAEFFPLLAQNLDNPAVIQQGWAALVEVNSNSWLTPAVQSLVENYATQNGIPLVAS